MEVELGLESLEILNKEGAVGTGNIDRDRGFVSSSFLTGALLFSLFFLATCNGGSGGGDIDTHPEDFRYKPKVMVDSEGTTWTVWVEIPGSDIPYASGDAVLYAQRLNADLSTPWGAFGKEIVPLAYDLFMGAALGFQEPFLNIVESDGGSIIITYLDLWRVAFP